MAKSVVVTGASGFLGSAIVRACRAARADVLPVSRSKAPGAVQLQRYAEAPAADVLIHLAEDNDRARVEGAGASYEAAAQETLDALLAKGYSTVVYASSAVLYGQEGREPHRAGDPVRVVDAYTRVKHRAETAVLASARGIVLRLANVYGPGMSPGNVVSTILRQIPGAGDVRVMDDRPVRDFVWIDDAARAFVAAALNAQPGAVYNVGSGEGVSIRELARTALDAAGETSRGIVAAEPRGEPTCIVLDIAATTAACGWRPQTPLAAGLRELVRAKTGLAPA